MARQIFNDVWASGGDKVDPGSVKTALGWVVEAPPHEHFNFYQGKSDEMFQHLERNGISEYNAATIYDLGGYAREGARTYRSLVVTNSGNLPSTSPTQWVQAFYQVAEAAGVASSNTFTANQTVKVAAGITQLTLDADAGFDTWLSWREAGVVRALHFYDESQDTLRQIKYDTNGTTVKSDLQFKNTGDVDLVTGILKVAGNLVMHKGNDGTGSGFDADTVDGIEGAALAKLGAANAFTSTQSSTGNITLDNSTADTPNFVMNDPVNNSNASLDVSGESFRILTQYRGGAVATPVSVNLNTGIATFTATPTVSGNVLFHVGNDGAGSGLDADLLDGIQGSNYARTDIAEVFAGNVSITSSALSIVPTSAANANIEIGHTGGTATTPFIDFHSGATATDYDVRLLASGGTGASGGGVLTLTATTFNVLAALQVSGNLVFHAGNDGAGSGLDADTVDGVQAAAFGKLATVSSWTRMQQYTSVGLVDGTTIAWDIDVAPLAEVTITANRTMSAPTNIQTGKVVTFRVRQDASGSRTLAWDATFDFGDSGAPTLSTTANMFDYITFIGRGTTALDFLGIKKGYT